MISHFRQFLREATVRGAWPAGTGQLLRPYISWCLLQRIGPVPEIDFEAAMCRRGVDIQRSGLAMTGAAAADDILAAILTSSEQERFFEAIPQIPSVTRGVAFE